MKKLIISLVLALPLSTKAAPNRDIMCLAQNVYNEARGEGFKGMLAVAQVTINRTKDERFHETLCEVVHAKKQFSWTMQPNHKPPDENSIMIAALALTGNHEFKNFKALFYHSNKINPKWKHKRLTKIGNHIFYL